MNIHIWDLLKIPNLCIAVNTKKLLKDEIKNKILNNISLVAKNLDIKPARLYEYFIWQKSAIPLNILISLSRDLNITKNKIEKGIIIYKQLYVPEKNSIKWPKLPIEISPYLTSTLSNLFFDGSVPKDGKGTYYNQKNKEIMEDFIKKLKYIFGDVSYSLTLDHRGVLKCRVPRLIGEICRGIFEVGSFGTFDSRIPKKIFDFNIEHKIAFVLTALIDEGSIAYDGNIIFGISNKNMCEDVRKLCIEIGLKADKIRTKKNSNFYYFHILSLKELYNLLLKFSKKYPLISLRYKEERLKKALEIKNQKHYHSRSFTNKRKSLLFEELKNKKCSINYLCSKYLIPPKTIRRDMYLMMKEGKVARKKVGNEYFYYLANFSIASFNSL